ncbi:hypothetical protein VNO77_18988 [Canavalia gladiata]|uniref:Uncharacterized protein n=1 Tax=Canavalia gladiata TaxID=3824 RepID=A0AAN9LMJ6_CANGL
MELLSEILLPFPSTLRHVAFLSINTSSKWSGYIFLSLKLLDQSCYQVLGTYPLGPRLQLQSQVYDGDTELGITFCGLIIEIQLGMIEHLFTDAPLKLASQILLTNSATYSSSCQLYVHALTFNILLNSETLSGKLMTEFDA